MSGGDPGIVGITQVAFSRRYQESRSGRGDEWTDNRSLLADSEAPPSAHCKTREPRVESSRGKSLHCLPRMADDICHARVMLNASISGEIDTGQTPTFSACQTTKKYTLTQSRYFVTITLGTETSNPGASLRSPCSGHRSRRRL